MSKELEETFQKNKLLNELQQLGYHSDGRKQRSDKGKSRGQIAKPEETSPKSKLSIYMRVKQRMFNRDQALRTNGGSGILLEMDENSFYLSIPAKYVTKGEKYVQVSNGRRIEHSVKRVRVQKEVDLEHYRFDAYKEQALLHGSEAVQEKYWPEIRQMLNIRYGFTGDEATAALKKRQITWEQLFCEFYFLSIDDYWEWDYAHWQRDYSYVPTQQLPEDFVFDFNNYPGSEKFHPEWSYKAEERIKQEQEEKEQEQKRKSEQFIMNMHKRSKLW